MPFGLCNAPATFQRLMNSVLAGLPWNSCLVYLDDIIVKGRTFPDHLDNLSQVFQRIREAGLKLQPSKCALCSFLGHIVSPNGITTDPSKTNRVASWHASGIYTNFWAWRTTIAALYNVLPLSPNLFTASQRKQHPSNGQLNVRQHSRI